MHEEFSGKFLESRKIYWIKQDITSNFDSPREIDLRINGDIQFIDNIEIFIIKENKVVDVFSRSAVARNMISGPTLMKLPEIIIRSTIPPSILKRIVKQPFFLKSNLTN